MPHLSTYPLHRLAEGVEHRHGTRSLRWAGIDGFSVLIQLQNCCFLPITDIGYRVERILTWRKQNKSPGPSTSHMIIIIGRNVYRKRVHDVSMTRSIYPKKPNNSIQPKLAQLARDPPLARKTRSEASHRCSRDQQQVGKHRQR